MQFAVSERSDLQRGQATAPVLDAHRVNVVHEAFGQRCRLMREAEQQSSHHHDASHGCAQWVNLIAMASQSVPPVLGQTVFGAWQMLLTCWSAQA